MPNVGDEVYILVNAKWYEELQKGFSFGSACPGSENTKLLVGKMLGDDGRGVWLAPDKDLVGEGVKVYFPWSVIVSVAVFPDGQKPNTKIGFETTHHK